MDRISTSMTYTRHLSSLSRNSSALLKAQEQAISGKKIANLSESANTPILQLREKQRQNQNFTQAAHDGQESLLTQESAVRQISSSLTNVQSILIEGIQPSYSKTDREHLAHKIDLILDEMAELSATRHGQQYVFGGTETLRPPFTFEREGDSIVKTQYNGNEEERQIEIGFQRKFSVNIAGNKIFSNAFDTLVKVRDMLRNKDNLPETEQLEKLSEFLNDVKNVSNNNLSHLADLGNRIAHLEEKSWQYEERNLQLTQQISYIEEIDLPQAVTELWARENAYQATLHVLARIPQQGLLQQLS